MPNFNNKTQQKAGILLGEYILSGLGATISSALFFNSYCAKTFRGWFGQFLAGLLIGSLAKNGAEILFVGVDNILMLAIGLVSLAFALVGLCCYELGMYIEEEAASTKTYRALANIFWWATVGMLS